MTGKMDTVLGEGKSLAHVGDNGPSIVLAARHFLFAPALSNFA
jgi:hypothetical protein